MARGIDDEGENGKKRSDMDDLIFQFFSLEFLREVSIWLKYGKLRRYQNL